MVIVSGFEFALCVPDVAFFFTGIYLVFLQSLGKQHSRLDQIGGKLPDRGQESFFTSEKYSM